MEFGLLWYDRDPKRDLEAKIGRAALRYREKYGQMPNTCYVHPHLVNGSSEPKPKVTCQLTDPPATIRVMTAPNMLRHHFWLGVNGRQGATRRKKTIRKRARR